MTRSIRLPRRGGGLLVTMRYLPLRVVGTSWKWLLVQSMVPKTKMESYRREKFLGVLAS